LESEVVLLPLLSTISLRLPLFVAFPLPGMEHRRRLQF
jgi:hypothetical protein